ncbi:hypothetical protein PDESU_00820 [Pontiella desulfatans]|uniref:STAS/SEC14 domain-containing protein n=1 Tax=Pontiella desulfatans TaxID=2750659 RepID=A0A6C2TXB4_PONDE|nr:hypothetical protein [Pontiella desulfatans]VGO12269.1 hypothetical protein PDESU_00820 [Pontiella desulfatans]
MGTELCFSSNKSRADITCTGNLDGKGMRKIVERLTAPDMLPRLKQVFLDYTAVEHFEINLADIQYMAEKCNESTQERPQVIAIAVVTRRLLAIRLTRMWQAFTPRANVELEIFPRAEDAESWLEKQ